MSDTTIFYTLFGANACSSTKESNNNNNINSLIFKMGLMNGKMAHKINALIQVVYSTRFHYFIVWKWIYFLNKYIIDVISFSIEIIIDKIKRFLNSTHTQNQLKILLSILIWVRSEPVSAS